MLNDKHYLAVLAIPVLLSMVLGLSAGPYADTALASRDKAEEVSDTTDLREESIQDEGGHFRNRSSGARTGDGRNKRNEMVNAIESGNYDAFLVAAKDTPFAEVMTADAFDVLVREYHLRRGFHPSRYLDAG